MIPALLAHFLGGGPLRAAEFEVLDRFSVYGYTVLRGSADIPGGSFTVGVSTFVVKGGNVGIGTEAPTGKLTVASGQIFGPEGTAANPGYSWGSAPGYGIYLFSGNDMRLGAGGVGQLWIGSTRSRFENQLLVTDGSAAAPAIGFSNGGTNTGIFKPTAGVLGFSTGGAEKMRINSSGYVGIGTTAPGSRLNIAGASVISTTNFVGSTFSAYFEPDISAISSGSSIGLRANGTGNFSIGAISQQPASAGWRGLTTITYMSDTVAADQGFSINQFHPNNAQTYERFRIDSAGNVGIGTMTPATTFDVAGTAAIKIPVGSSAERPSSPANGMMRVNTTTGKLEYYYNSMWTSIGGVAATGGTINDSVSGYRIHTFTAGGTFTVTSGGNVEVLVVAGGGGGGSWYGGGGGAGGLIYAPASFVASGSYPVVVGSGGAGRPATIAGSNATDSFGSKGGNSSFNSLIALGGGGGPGYNAQGRADIEDGGSGAGGRPNNYDASYTYGRGSSGQGNNGAPGDGDGSNDFRGGGGGGAGGAGAPGTSTGAGGIGLSYSISGAAAYYAGGGGGGAGNTAGHTSPGGLGGGGIGRATVSGSNADPNTGGGGGGSTALDASSGGVGGDGGSGIVIIRYAN